jgi:histidine triad (HIT) family protein
MQGQSRTLVTMTCPFCTSIDESIGTTAVYADNLSYAIADLNPGPAVHVMIVPRTLPNEDGALNDTDLRDPAVLGHLLGIAAEIARARQLAGGYRIIVNTGEDDNPSANKLHVHLLSGLLDSETRHIPELVYKAG